MGKAKSLGYYPPSTQGEVVNVSISSDVTMEDGDGKTVNLGQATQHNVRFAYTTNGYFVIIIDGTIVDAFRGGTIISK